MTKSNDLLQRRRAYGVLGVAIAGLLIAWTIVLPWVGQQKSIRTMIDRNESHGIDPTAMFYTELTNMSVQNGTLRRIPNDQSIEQ